MEVNVLNIKGEDTGRKVALNESVFGITVSGRNCVFDNIENTIGLFVNTLPLRIVGNERFSSVICKTGIDISNINENASLHINDIKKISGIENNELFDSIFVIENYPLDLSFSENSEFKITGYEMHETTNFDLTLEFAVFNRKLSVNYNHEKWSESEIARIIDNYKRLIDFMLTYPDSCLDDFELANESEKKMIMEQFNASHVDYKKGDTIYSLFMKQVEETPNNIALAFQNEKFTYLQLSEKVCKMCNWLASNDVQKGDRVGIILNRSIEMVVSMLAIMRLGCAYIPIDSAYPDERINYIIIESECKCIISKSSISFNNVGKKRLNIDCCCNMEDCEFVPACVDDELVAYIIYTSGSTGKPNGVLVKHRSIVNTLLWRKEYYNFSELDIVLQLPSFSFDSSVEDIFTILISGGKLCLVSEKERHTLNTVKKIIENEAVTHILSVPSYYKTLLKEIPEAVAKLRFVTIAGESFNVALVHEHFRIAGKTQLFNEYGPTENSVCSTIYQFTESSDEVLIGKPISNVECYIMNKNGQLNPPNVAGELCVAGLGLTVGYLNNAKKTEEKFVYNKYIGKMVYKTGDIAIFKEDGNIKFVGRKDHQIKIRGFRIEKDEIIGAVSSFPNITDVTIIEIKKQEASSIACFFTANTKVNVSKLREHSEKLLPKYMVPSYFIQIDKIPLTHNGKTDDKKLYGFLKNAEIKKVFKKLGFVIKKFLIFSII